MNENAEENKQAQEILNEIIIRGERNLDRYSSFLFPHQKSPDLHKKRRKELIFKKDGKEYPGGVVVTPAVDAKCYSLRTYDVYLAILSLWEEKGRPTENWQTTLSQIAKRMEISNAGKHLTMIREELDCLYATYVSWILIFEKEFSQHNTETNVRILDTCNYNQKKERIVGSGTSTKVTLCFSKVMLENLLNNVTIPINFKSRRSIKSGISRSLYNRLDNILAYNDVYRMKVANLVIELNASSERYKYKSKRKEFADMLYKNLHGKELSKIGTFISIQIRETSNKEDWLLIFSKTQSAEKLKIESKRNTPRINTDKYVIADIIEMITDAVGGKEKNKGLYTVIAQSYSHTMIQATIGELKEIIKYNPDISQPGRYLTSLIHAHAHRQGKNWIKPCGPDCKFRPENQLIQY